MAEVRPPLLALPPPPTSAPVGLRASLRGAAAMPVDPVQPGRPAHDPAFGADIVTVYRDRLSDPSGQRPRFSPLAAEDSARDWAYARFFADQSVPFLAQQLGQSGRLVAPTLDANAEIAAYAAAQARAERAAQDRESLLDVRA